LRGDERFWEQRFRKDGVRHTLIDGHSRRL
jgi:hypothetical protein